VVPAGTSVRLPSFRSDDPVSEEMADVDESCRRAVREGFGSPAVIGSPPTEENVIRPTGTRLGDEDRT
jgi:hypothetical protein